MANNLFRYRNYKPGTASSLRRRRYKQGIVIHLLSFLPCYKTTPITTREERYRKRHHGMGHVRRHRKWPLADLQPMKGEIGTDRWRREYMNVLPDIELQ